MEIPMPTEEPGDTSFRWMLPGKTSSPDTEDTKVSMKFDNGTYWADSQADNFQAPTEAGPVQTTVVHTGMYMEAMGWILSAGSMLIIGTNLLVGTALILLIRKKGSQSWCFVLNLALADSLVGFAITGIASSVINGNTSRAWCLLQMSFLTLTSAASILTMFLISLDRYVAIKLPLRYSQMTGIWMTVTALVVLWLLSFTMGFLLGMVRQMQQSQYGGFCTFFSVLQPKSVILVFCICFFPVLSVFLYFYSDILKIACAHQRQIRQARLAGTRVPLSHRCRGHVKALKTVALLVGCFTLSWCPFFIVSTVQVLCKSCELHHIIENYLWLLGLSNSLLNPLVYACWQREVRQELCTLFACIRSRLSNATCITANRRRDTEQP